MSTIKIKFSKKLSCYLIDFSIFLIINAFFSLPSQASDEFKGDDPSPENIPSELLSTTCSAFVNSEGQWCDSTPIGLKLESNTGYNCGPLYLTQRSVSLPQTSTEFNLASLLHKPPCEASKETHRADGPLYLDSRKTLSTPTTSKEVNLTLLKKLAKENVEFQTKCGKFHIHQSSAPELMRACTTNRKSFQQKFEIDGKRFDCFTIRNIHPPAKRSRRLNSAPNPTLEDSYL